jgi:hypothetical protein
VQGNLIESTIMTTGDVGLLCDLVRQHDREALVRAISAGADPNARDAHGTPFLFEALDLCGSYESARQGYEMIEALLDLGADPRLLEPDGGNVLAGPIFCMRADLIELLLTRGVDPNHGCGEIHETVYDLACFDYFFEEHLEPEPRVLRLRDCDVAEKIRYLNLVDDEAVASGKRRPDYLITLRSYGALNGSEIARSLGGEPDAAILWRDGRWTLDDRG